MYLHTYPCGHWLPHEPGGGVRLLFGALLAQYAKKAAITRGQTIVAKTPCVPLAPPTAEYTKISRFPARQSRSLLLLFGALLAQYAKKAAITRGQTIVAKTRCVFLAPPTAEYTKISRFSARQSRCLLLLFGALLAQYAKKAAITRGQTIEAKTRCVPLAPPTAEYTKISRFSARQSRSLLLLFGALLAQYAKKAAITRGLFINKRIWSATSDGGRAFWAQPC